MAHMMMQSATLYRVRGIVFKNAEIVVWGSEFGTCRCIRVVFPHGHWECWFLELLA